MTKNIMRYRDSRTAKAGKQGWDDSIKQFSIETHPTHVDRYNIALVLLFWPTTPFSESGM